jgi:hypothetical protein
MMTLMMFILFLVVFGRIAGRVLGETERTGRFRRRRMRWDDADSLPPQPESLPPTRVETPVESLQRRFAAGDITMEEYEREVGRLFGVKQTGEA